ncbi:AMIN domain protein, partial [Vibrio parahaemolyticus VPTS-2010]
AKT